MYSCIYRHFTVNRLTSIDQQGLKNTLYPNAAEIYKGGWVGKKPRSLCSVPKQVQSLLAATTFRGARWRKNGLASHIQTDSSLPSLSNIPEKCANSDMLF